jgi:protein-S-isoprenylcysteine O-methyltransferase Ste14
MKLLVPPPIVALICAAAIWGSVQLLPDWRFAFVGQTWVGGAVILAGLMLDLVSVAGFVRARTTVTPLAPEKASTLVTSGFYRFTRNPMYLGMLLILIGVTIMLGAPLGPFAAMAFAAYITEFQIKPEEERLEVLFGQQFAEYRRSVRRWL